jgi:lactoylglutathione lyase
MKLGYTLLYVDDVELAMDFYEAAFGLTKGFLHESGQYGEMATGETKLGFVQHETASSHNFKYQKANKSNKPFGCEVGLVTKDVGKAFDTAVKAGALVAYPPTEMPWGQMVSYVRDCHGFLIEICSPMAE